MTTLQELFTEAFRFWDEKADEPPKNGFQTYDHFKKLGKAVETLSIRTGFGGFKVKVSVGQGCWAEIPWIGIRHPDFTDNFEEGEYVVYLLAPDYKRLHLGIIQGVTKLTPQEIDERTARLRKGIACPNGFLVGIDGKLSEKEPFGSKPDKYKRGLFYSKKYDVRAMPIDDVLANDLKAALQAYRDYINKNT